MKKVGYHYTPYKNWLQIKHLGLVPYPLHRLRSYQINGIWLWPSPLLGWEHVGNIIFHVAEKKTMQIVLLEVMYDEGDIWRPDEVSIYRTLHNGSIGSWQYHFDREGVVVMNRIPPEDIKLKKVFDLEVLLSYGDNEE